MHGYVQRVRLMRLYPPILFFLHILYSAAAITEKVDRVAPVVNSWTFNEETIMDGSRQYVVHYILNPAVIQSFFLVFEIVVECWLRRFREGKDSSVHIHIDMCEHLPVSRVVMYSMSLLVCFACLYKAYGSATYRIKAP